MRRALSPRTGVLLRGGKVAQRHRRQRPGDPSRNGERQARSHQEPGQGPGGGSGGAGRAHASRADPWAPEP